MTYEGDPADPVLRRGAMHVRSTNLTNHTAKKSEVYRYRSFHTLMSLLAGRISVMGSHACRISGAAYVVSTQITQARHLPLCSSHLSTRPGMGGG